ncbi:MAG: restriction endonuclease subunit S [Plesiomonas shigelloides]
MAELIMQNQVGEMAAKQTIPAGYKLTEVGVIPDDWVVSTMSSLTSLMTNGFVGTAKTHYTEAHDGVTYIQGYNVEENKFNFHGIKKVSAEFHRKNAKSCLRAGDLLMVQTGDVGLVTVVPPELEGANCHALIINRFRAEYNSAYFSFLFNSQQGRLRLKELETGTTMKHINVGDLLNFVVAYPPDKVEQTAIANVLSDTDALIDALEQLIAKKQAIKSATMQQLLTGRTRLPQFALRPDGTPKGYKSSELGQIPEDWGCYTFNDVVDSCSSGATPYRGNKDFYKGTNRWITSGELNYCIINDTIEKISDEAIKKSNLNVHPQGTFLMAITGLEAAGTRGACGIVGWPATTNQSCMAIYPNEKLSSEYLYYWYVHNGENLAFKYCQGTKQLSYTAGLIKKIPLYLPTIKEEQTAIATILSDMDNELQALTQKLEKARALKQGMMQQLLTGRIRLPLPQEA